MIQVSFKDADFSIEISGVRNNLKLSLVASGVLHKDIKL